MAIIELATAWNAIILIDEADIFLEQRSLNDIQRNGLVSSKPLYTPHVLHLPPA